MVGAFVFSMFERAAGYESLPSSALSQVQCSRHLDGCTKALVKSSAM